ncbi:MAG: VanZ family protein [Lachnospiraceae bacterium]
MGNNMDTANKMINWNMIEWGSERQWNKAIDYLSQIVVYNIWFWVLVIACLAVVSSIIHDYYKQRNLENVVNNKKLLFLYVYFLIYTALLNRTPSVSPEFFLWSPPIVEDGVVHESRFLEHVTSALLFLPFGLLTYKIKKLTEFQSKVLFALVLIVFIEILQFVTTRGVCNIADIVDALIGTVVGYYIVHIMKIKDRGDR